MAASQAPGGSDDDENDRTGERREGGRDVTFDARAPWPDRRSRTR